MASPEATFGEETTAFCADLAGTLCEHDPRPENIFLARGNAQRVRRLNKQCQLVVITGRAAQDARNIVGPGTMVYGVYGAQELDAWANSPTMIPDYWEGAKRLEDFVTSYREELARAGIFVQPQGGVSWMLHLDRSDDPARAQAFAEHIKEEAEKNGFFAEPLGTALDIRSLNVDKGLAIQRLLEAFPSLRRIAMIGDDWTDFRAMMYLRKLERAKRLDRVTNVYVTYPDRPEPAPVPDPDDETAEFKVIDLRVRGIDGAAEFMDRAIEIFERRHRR